MFSLHAKIVAILLVVVALIGGAWKAYHTIDERGYNRHKAETEARAELQRESNRGRAYAAESAQAGRETVRTVYITKIEKELRHEAKNLDACRLDAGDLSLLQRAAACAREDRPASCRAGEQVRNPG